jgi:hypothetical protein
VYWRHRLAKSARPHRVNDAVKTVIEQTGILRGRRRRAVDSTILADAVATQDTVTQLVAAIRRVAREVPGAAEQITAVCTGHDYAKPGKPKIDWDDPAAKDALVSALVNDATALVAALGGRELDEPAAWRLGLRYRGPARCDWQGRAPGGDQAPSRCSPRCPAGSPSMSRPGWSPARPDPQPAPHHGLLRAARAGWAASPGLREDYMAHRPNVERAIAQVASRRGRRVKLHYRGVTRNHAWLKYRTAALNLRNLTGRGLTRRGGAWVLAT